MAHNRVNARLGKREVTMAEFLEAYNKMADRGLPIPPSNPTAEISDAAIQSAYIRGATHTVGTLVVLGALGGLLWASYKH